MGLLFLLVAVLGLAFPPLAVVFLAMMVFGVFAKGLVADPDQKTVARRKSRHRRGAERPQDAMRRHATEPRQGEVVDVRFYPFLPPLGLPTAIAGDPRSEAQSREEPS